MTKHAHHQPRSGFSLASLVVVIAIIGLLIALMLPALSKVRGAADRAKSQNNLKQLALAAHNYASTYNDKFPAGNDKDNVSAHVHLLPYIEQANLHDTFTKKGRKAIESVRIPTYESPRDPLKDEVTKDLAPTNYLFNAGSDYALKGNNGPFYQDSSVGIATIPDGTSNTVMCGETLRGDGGAGDATVARRHIRLKSAELKELDEKSGVADFEAGKNLAGDRGASWADGRFLQGTYTGTITPNSKAPDVDCGGLGGLSALRSVDDIVLIALCDGSVRGVSISISLKTWRDVHNCSDGNVLGSDF